MAGSVAKVASLRSRQQCFDRRTWWAALQWHGLLGWGSRPSRPPLAPQVWRVAVVYQSAHVCSPRRRMLGIVRGPARRQDVCLLDIRLLQQKYQHRVKASASIGAKLPPSARDAGRRLTRLTRAHGVRS